MTLERPHRSGSFLNLCLIFVLGISFLSPLYHCHDHAADNHDENSGGHPLLPEGSDHEDLSGNEQHNEAHLHIKTDIGRTDTHRRFKSGADAYAAAESPGFTENLLSALMRHSKTLIFRSNVRACLSGLSPPAA